MKIVEVFEYLKVWLSTHLNFGHKLAVGEEKARLPTPESSNLRLLKITSTEKLEIYFRSFVERGLFPVQGVAVFLTG